MAVVYSENAGRWYGLEKPLKSLRISFGDHYYDEHGVRGMWLNIHACFHPGALSHSNRNSGYKYSRCPTINREVDGL